MDKQIHQLIETMLELLVGLCPAALGAAVSLVYEKGLTWRERFVQWVVGIIVSWFAGRAIGALFSLSPFVLQAVSFTLGMIAFKAVPKFIASCTDAVAGLPSDLRDRFLPRKKDSE
ncbi:hypothetical protein AWL63_06145 [Sphingomonas panacis]|uniref:Holin n=1 Tax=Sphingomonas panacis TaxID=1560345 RepID=A0A1B3Z852_9SPHN|nr:hypothetical protein [Sphingomonas panacis]AOH83615.1 hypothetical protein AWL63_06145 [Sphingomonas panacis]